MADLEIRVVRATDPERFLNSDHTIWFDEVSDDPLDLQLRGVPADQRFVAELPGVDVDPGTYPGIYGVRPMHLSVPDGEGAGRMLPVAGLTWVGVHPDHRRRGLLTAMLRHHFAQSRDEGVHVSALHASEPAIYGRHGYGLASIEHSTELGRGTTLTAPHLEDEVATLQTRMVDATGPDIAARRRRCDLAIGPACVGSIVGDNGFYEELGHVSAADRRGNEIPRVIFATRDGDDVGYVVFRRSHHWSHARPSAEIDVRQLSGGPAARLALLRRVVDLDLAGKVKLWGTSQDDPLLSWVDGPRATGALEPYDSLWVRLVDLPEALSARGYDEGCDVVVDVTDVAAPWNAGRWRIRVKDGTAEVTRTDDDPEIALPVSALGAAYLGGTNLVAMQRAGVLDERRPGAVSDLWRAFRTDVTPYAARGF